MLTWAESGALGLAEGPSEIQGMAPMSEVILLTSSGLYTVPEIIRKPSKQRMESSPLPGSSFSPAILYPAPSSAFCSFSIASGAGRNRTRLTMLLLLYLSTFSSSVQFSMLLISPWSTIRSRLTPIRISGMASRSFFSAARLSLRLSDTTR